MVKVFYEIIIKYQLGLQSSEDLTGTRGPASKMAHSPGCWQEASVTWHTGLFIWPLECLHDMAAGFPRTSDPRESEERATLPFMSSHPRSHAASLLPHSVPRVTKFSLHSRE